MVGIASPHAVDTTSGLVSFLIISTVQTPGTHNAPELPIVDGNSLNALYMST